MVSVLSWVMLTASICIFSSSAAISASEGSEPEKSTPPTTQGKVGLRASRSTIGADPWLVGLHHIAADIQIGTPIGAREMEAAEPCQKAREGSLVENHAGLERGQRTVSLRAEFDRHHHLRSR